MKYEKVDGGYFIRLFKGEEIPAALCKFITQKKIGGGYISGLGAVNNVTLGYFDLERQKYLKEEFPGIYELVSLTGNIAYVEGEPFVHAHVLISDQQMVPRAGHLFAGTIAITGEFFIAVAGKKFRRTKDPEVGLNLLDFTLPRK